jgi:uncharacterized surface protein with fasciclin (FAS1) repeats
VEYHLANETHPSATFGIEPLFPATLLSNTSYTNVTGGQRVEMMLDNDQPAIVSGIKAMSRIVRPDIFFIGGLIHVIDSVLTIPVSFPATITAAGLNDFVALLNSGGWLNPSSQAAEIVNSLADLTIWGPNDPRFGATFTGFDAFSEEQLDAIFRYSIVQGQVVYSDQLKNNSQFKTLEGRSVILTETDGAFYVDQARITSRDFLCSNGVLQVIDQPLNPETSGIRPTIVPADEEKSDDGGLSSAAAAGIGIAVGVLLLGGGLIAALVIRNRRKNRGQMLPPDQSSRPRGSVAQSLRMFARRVTKDTLELEFNGPPPRYGAHELDNKGLGNGYRTQVGETVVELSHSPEPRPGVSPMDGHEGASPGGVISPDSATRSPDGSRVIPNFSRSRSNTASPQNRASTYSNAASLNLRGPAGSGLPPSPPNTRGGVAEIDGQEAPRNKISISFTGDAPRHLGFQARY